MPELLISDFSLRRCPGETGGGGDGDDGDDDGGSDGTTAGRRLDDGGPYDYTKKDS